MRVKCSECSQYKIQLIKYIKNRKYYLDDNNKRWKTKSSCYDCNKKYMNNLIRKTRKETRTYFNDIEIYHSNRQCRSCHGKIEKSRWINCLKCKPELPSDDEYIFENSDTKASELSLLTSA